MASNKTMCEQPPSDEGQQILRLAVEPLRVVNKTQNGLSGRSVSKQRQGGKPDEEQVRGPPAKRPKVVSRAHAAQPELSGSIEYRDEESAQTGKAQGLFCFDTVHLQDLEVAGSLLAPLEASLPAYEQYPARGVSSGRRQGTRPMFNVNMLVTVLRHPALIVNRFRGSG